MSNTDISGAIVDASMKIHRNLGPGLAPVHTKQILTYLRLSNNQIGLILNFGAGMMKEGIKRVIDDRPR